MKIFLTSDLHFFHRNIVKYCPESRGQYTSIEEMNDAIVSNFNSVVSEQDHTYILGDISFGSPAETMEMLKAMNGTKTIIHGNHDRKLIKSSEFQSQKQLAGIIEDTPYKVINHNRDGIVLFHFPIESWDGAFHGSIHFHGHVHSDKASRLTPGRRRLDVGVDGNDMMPWLIEDAINEAKKNDANDTRGRN